jgi:uncharacterized protein
MRIGILSDTHDQVARTASAVRRLIAEGAELLIHCGDLTTPEIVEEFAGIPTYFVFGNNDYDEDRLRRTMVDVGGVCLGRAGEISLGEKRLAVTHGDSVTEFRRQMKAEPDYLFTGHTHVASDDRAGRTRHINPGALSRARTYTVALLDPLGDHLRMLTIQDGR